MAATVVYDEIALYESSTEYRLEPVVRTSDTRALTLDRSTGEIVLQASNSRPAPTKPSRTVYGVYGILPLSTCDYLILITGRERRGTIFGNPVYRATDFAVLPLATSNTEHPVEKHLLALVRTHLKTGTFWFSYGWDLTTKLQNKIPGSTKPLWEQADDRFFWNKYLQSRFIDITQSDSSQNLSRYILPVLYGSFDIRPAKINQTTFLFCLISRRARHRAGTRYFSRGIDTQGHVSNFNETEQLIVLTPPSVPSSSAPDAYSYIQTRGSVPLFWTEINTLRYRPDLQIMDVGATPHALRSHLADLKHNYGDVVLVNLVNQVGYERPVKEAFERAMEDVMEGPAGLSVGLGRVGKVEGVGYEYFDFHKECKGMRWDRIQLLVDRLQERLDSHGYFHVSPTSASPIQTQKGVVRTNCMDCLDRTNVVQSTLAKRVLEKQLTVAGVLAPGETIDTTEFLPIFRNAWADHADYVSNAYSGSGALKADFTRTGVRTKGGAMRDGMNSVKRYLKNNYFDGPRQDAFDLMTGSWIARRFPSTGMNLVLDKRPLMIRSMPHVAAFSVFMILAGLTLPRTSEYSLVYYNALWLIFLIISTIFISIHGTAYVAWPRLNASAVRDVLMYDGPGYRSAQHGRGMGGKKGKGGVRMGHAGSEKGSVGRMEEVEMVLGSRRHLTENDTANDASTRPQILSYLRDARRLLATLTAKKCEKRDAGAPTELQSILHYELQDKIMKYAQERLNLEIEDGTVSFNEDNERGHGEQKPIGLVAGGVDKDKPEGTASHSTDNESAKQKEKGKEANGRNKGDNVKQQTRAADKWGGDEDEKSNTNERNETCKKDKTTGEEKRKRNKMTKDDLHNHFLRGISEAWESMDESFGSLLDRELGTAGSQKNTGI